ncbi:MAG: glycerol-3-phosphate 1-O-acyltransferase PlsY [Oscillospiraceae bacterium]|nr:glycerol-3-phosphate 1-O-acyltransferase PlsY [Oscillospiraceae bacterium]
MAFKILIGLLISAVVSYLLGSCNSAIIVCKLWKKTDIRTLGSKNAGLTNTYRVFGKGPALLTLLGDLSKGVIAVLLSRLVFSLLGAGLYAGTGMPLDIRFVGYISGIFAMLGHIFPVYYGFKGGKGVLVACSILLVIDPLSVCILVPFFALIVILTRYVSVASISAATAYPFVTLISQTLRGFPNVWINTLLVLATSALIIYMHKENIKRLKNGTENKFGTKKANK